MIDLKIYNINDYIKDDDKNKDKSYCLALFKYYSEDFNKNMYVLFIRDLDKTKCFYDWKNYIAHVVCESYDIDNHDLETKNAKEIIKKGLPLDSKKYNNRNFGDYQLDLVGFKFWAGGIWGDALYVRKK